MFNLSSSASRSETTTSTVYSQGAYYTDQPIIRTNAVNSYRIVGVALIALGCLAIALSEPFVGVPLILLGLIMMCGSKAIKFAVNILINCCMHSSRHQSSQQQLPTTRSGLRTMSAAQPAQPAPAVPTSQLQGAKDARGISQPAAQSFGLPLTSTNGSTVRAERPGSSLDGEQKPLKRNKNAQPTSQPAAVPPGNAGGHSLLNSSVVYAQSAPSAPSQMGLALESRGISGKPTEVPNASMFASFVSPPAADAPSRRGPAPASRVNETPAAASPREAQPLSSFVDVVPSSSSSSSASGQRGAEPGSRRK